MKRTGKIPLKEEEFNKIVLDNIPVSVITIDKEGNITSSNKYFRNFSRKGPLKNKNIFSEEFFIRENLVEDYKKLLSQGAIVRRDDCHEINSKGEDKYLRITAVPFRNKKGQITGAISLASDNTKIVEFRNELTKVLELKSIFMADISHEFRTSLTIMRCSLELLAKNCGEGSKDAELFDNVISEIRRASNMLSDLSLLAKSDSSKLELKGEKVNVNSCIASICKKLKSVAGGRNIKIEYNKNASAIFITADEEGVEKMILNLVRNAVEYNDSGGWVKVWAEENKEGVCIKVEDDGIGIDEKEIPNIFERFYRVDKARTRDGENFGLGLAICKEVAKAHGGSIKVESKIGKGSLFTVFLPYNLN